MHHLGILAFGSLVAEAGPELDAATATRISDIRTPFCVEFARRSITRGGAPTLVQVKTGGAKVLGAILVLRDDLSVAIAADMLWRRETNVFDADARYRRPAAPSADSVLVERLERFHRIAVVLYTRIAPNIESPTPKKLAELAIASAQSPAGLKRRDGISYLLLVKRSGIRTPLMEDYEREILRQTETTNLEKAWRECRGRLNL